MSRSSEINRIVKDEVRYIPRHPQEHQSDLRVTYAILRERSLGKHGDPSKTAGDVMQAAVASVLEKYPDADLKYDEQFFASGVAYPTL